MIYIVTATLTSLWSTLTQQLSRLYELYRYNTYHVSRNYIVTTPSTPNDLPGYSNYDPYCYSTPMLYTATATIPSLCSISLQHLLCPYEQHWYSTYYVLLIYIVTTNITSLWLILSQQLLRPYDPYCYSNYYVFMPYVVTAPNIFQNYIATATTTPLWAIWLQQLPHLYDP